MERDEAESAKAPNGSRSLKVLLLGGPERSPAKREIAQTPEQQVPAVLSNRYLCALVSKGSYIAAELCVEGSSLG
jgi:hypothetical protein